jgi:hypothetical protein
VSAGLLDLTVEQGATFTRTISVVDGSDTRDLSGYSARAQIRENFDSTTTIISSTSAADGGIVIDTDENTLTWTISAAETAKMDFLAARYDLELIRTSDGRVERLLQGTVSLNKEVTR